MEDSASYSLSEMYNTIELPSSVEIKESLVSKGETGAFCKAFIKKDTRFGPYKGEIIKPSQKTKANINYRYAWEVFEKRSNVLKYIISASDPKKGNWMRNVNSARFYEEQNILSVQEGFSIYYVAMMDIKPGDELLTWFDPKLLKKSQRRQTKRERRQVGYTIELVPWSDEKRFVPEIIETKRARKKKVLSDMISFDEDAPLVQRSLNSVLRASKNKDVPCSQKIDRRFKKFRNLEALSNGTDSGGVSNRMDSIGRFAHSSAYHNGASRSSTSINRVGKSTLVNSMSSHVSLNSHRCVTDFDKVKSSLNQSPKKAVDKKISTSHHTAKARQAGQSSGNAFLMTTNTTHTIPNSSKVKGEKSETMFKPYDPTLLRPLIFRKKDNGCIEVEDHDEIYMTQQMFRSQCDDQCLCLNKSEILSDRVSSHSDATSSDNGVDKTTSEDLCINFSLCLGDSKTFIARNRIIFQCDICECAYNHAFSLKRHYLRIHINHRYLSRNDIIDCQIDTFHSGVEIKETTEKCSIQDIQDAKVETTNVKIPSLCDLARTKLGLSKMIDQIKSFKEELLDKEKIKNNIETMSVSESGGNSRVVESCTLKEPISVDDDDDDDDDDDGKFKEDSALTSEEGEKGAIVACAEKQENSNDEQGENVVSPVQADGIGSHAELAIANKEELPSQESISLIKCQAKDLSDCQRTEESQKIDERLEKSSENCENNHLEQSDFEAKIDQRTACYSIGNTAQNSEFSPPKISVSSCQSKRSDPEQKSESSDKESISSCKSQISEVQKSEVSPGKESTSCGKLKNLCPETVTCEMSTTLMDAKCETCNQDKEKEGEIRDAENNEADSPASRHDEENHYNNDNIDKAEESVKNPIGPPSDRTKYTSNEMEMVSSPKKQSVGESVSDIIPPCLPSPSLKLVTSTESKISSSQQQVILLLPIMSPTSAKPSTSNQQAITTSGSLAKSPSSGSVGLATTCSGPVNLIPPQSSLPMVVFSQFPPSRALPLVQGFSSMAGISSSDCTTTTLQSGSLSTLVVPDLSTSVMVSSQHNISTLSSSVPSKSLLPINAPIIQSTKLPNMYVSTSYLTGLDHEHPPADLYRCHMCVLVFKTTSELKHHIRNDPHRFKGGLKQYACQLCSLRFRNKHNLNRHNLMHHQNQEEPVDRKFRCLTCGKGFTSENYLRMHARFHLGKSFPCKYGCQDLVFPNAATLVKHLRAVHPGLNLKEYMREKRMKERMQRLHANNSEGMSRIPYSMYQPGIGFQAKRGRPKGSRNKSLSSASLVPECQLESPLDQKAGIPKEEIISQPIPEVGKENDSTFVNHFRFKCKLCPLSFAFHLRLLQHRSRVHGLPQSVQEFLHEMSKDITDSNVSNRDSLTHQFSPPPSPKSFFLNINSRGAENMQNYIEGSKECAEKYQKEELTYSITDDVKPLPKLEWTQYNFPVCFQYRDDSTAFYDGALPQQPSDLDVIGNEKKEGEANKSSISEEEDKSQSQQSYDICEKLVVDPSVITETKSEEIQELEEKSDDAKASKNDGNDKVLDWSQIIENVVDRELSAEVFNHGQKIAPSGKKTNNDEKETEMNCMGAVGAQSSGIDDKKSSLPVCDSGYSSLSSCVSIPDGTESEDQGNRQLLDTMLLELKRHSISSSCEEPDGHNETQQKNSERTISMCKFPLSKGISCGQYSPFDTMLVKALNLDCSPDKKIKSRVHARNNLTKKGFNLKLLKALDLPYEDPIGVITKLTKTDFVRELRKQCKLSLIFSSPSGQDQKSKSHEHQNLDSVLNMSDSSKHDHRRYSIWGRQHSHKMHTKNADAELIYCPVVECVRKSQVMKEKRTWKMNCDTGQKVKQNINQKSKESFAGGLGLMAKREYEQSYHANQKENHCIKPPEIWKIYDKIWFGKKGAITVVCSICHRHFSCLELCLRHQWKKHPHIEPLSLAMEKGNFVEDMYYYYPMAYGILAHTQLISDNMPPPEVYVCTRCSFPFKNLNKLHSHIIVCDPSQGGTTNRSQPLRKKKLLPMIDRRSQISSPDSKLCANKPRFQGTLSTSSKSQGQEIVLKKGYVLSSLAKANPQPEKRANTTLPTSRQFNTGIANSFLPSRHRRKNFGLLYNPSNHTRRREMYQVLDQHQCHGCNLKFKSMSLLERHVKKCSGKDKLRSQKPLLSALADDAAMRKQHTCRYCNKRFTFIKGVDLHYKRICSVRKVKEEENKLTEEDLAHEAELQRVIAHVKWSKSLNKDSSDIILGHVRMEEDGTLTRVNKKRGRPYGKTKKRIKKKGFKWTTLKRRRPGVDNAEDDDDGEDDSNEEGSKDSTEFVSTTPNKKIKVEVEVKSNSEETRKRKMSTSEVAPHSTPLPPRKKGRPRKTPVSSNLVETKSTLGSGCARPRRRGRPPLKRNEVSPKQKPDSKEEANRPPSLDSKAQVKADRASLQAAVEARRKESTRGAKQGSASQLISKPPTRKRGRPKKFDPSEMESSYKKKKKTDVDYVTISSAKKSAKDTLADSKLSNISLRKELLKDKKTKDEPDKKSMAMTGEQKVESCSIVGKVKKDIKVDKESKSISIFKTDDSIESEKRKASSVKNANNLINNQVKPTVIKVSKQLNNSTYEQKESDKAQSNELKTKEKMSKNSKTKEEHFKSPEQKPVSAELLKLFLTCDTPETSSSSSLSKSDSMVRAVSTIANQSEAKLGKEANVTAVKSPKNATKMISPSAKHVKIVSLTPSTLMVKTDNCVGDTSKQTVKHEVKELETSPSELKLKHLSSEEVILSQSIPPNSNIVVVSRSPASAVTLSPPSGKNQIMSTPLSLRVISMPSGSTQLVSSPSSIKFIKSPTSSLSKEAGPELVNVVPSSFINNASPPGKTPPQMSGPLSSPIKPVTVIHNSGILRSVSPSSAIPLVTGTNVQAPRIIKGNISPSSVRLPQVISGSIRLPRAIGTQLGSAVIVQQASMLQHGKTKVAVVPSASLCTPSSRFACSSVPIRVSGVPPGAKIVKIGNISSTVEVKPGSSTSTQSVSSPKTSPIASHCPTSTPPVQIPKSSKSPTEGQVEFKAQILTPESVELKVNDGVGKG